MTNSIVKLKFNGFQEWPGKQPLKLWTIEAQGHPFNGSTRSFEGLIELKIVPAKFIRFLRLTAC